MATKIAAPEGRLLRLLQEYQRSQNFLGLRDRTRSDYIVQIKKIEAEFGDMPTKALADRRARGVFMDCFLVLNRPYLVNARAVVDQGAVVRLTRFSG